MSLTRDLFAGLLTWLILTPVAFCQKSESAPTHEFRSARMLDIAVRVAERDHPRLDEAAVEKEIARLADLWRARAGSTPDAKSSVKALRDVLFDDVKFEAVVELDSPETLHIDSVLKTRRGYCLSLSIVALAIAERVGMP